MPGTRHKDQALGSGQGCEHPPGVVRLGGRVESAVDEQHGSGDGPGRQHRAHRIHLEMTLLFGESDGPVDGGGGKEEGCPFCQHGAQVGKSLRGHHCGYPSINSCRLKGHGCSKRGSDKHDRAGGQGIHYPAQIILLVIAIGGDVTA